MAGKLIKLIGGIEFEAVRKTFPRLHWRARVIKTQRELEQDYPTRTKMWEDLEHVRRIVGAERFERDTFS